MTRTHVIQTVFSLAENKGGPSRTVASLSEALTRTSVAVNLIAGTAPEDDRLMLPDPQLLVPALVPSQSLLGLRYYLGYGAAIDAAMARHPGAPTIVHDNGIWAPPNMAAMAAARARGLRHVISPHGMLQPWALDYHAWRKKLAMWGYQRQSLETSAGIFATAEAERAAVRRLLPRVPIAIIPNGVDTPSQLPAANLASTNVLFMSRLHPTKNLIGLIDAWAIVCARPELAAWRLTIAGPDEVGHLAQLRRRVEKLGLTARVDFVGQIPDVDKAAALADAALFILPSFTENFGIVVAEALAHGVPVIATHGAPWQDLETNRCGWWVAPTPEALASALQSAIALPPGERHAMGARGHAFVKRAFGWDRIATDAAQFYDWIITGGRAPDFVDAGASATTVTMATPAPSLTVIILAHDEARHIQRCIASVKPVATRVIVVDSGSTDGTAALAAAMGAEVLHNRWVNYATQFNWAIDNAGIDTAWMMRLDADEVVQPELRARMAALASCPANGITVNRQIHFLGRWIRWGGMYPVRVLRLWRSGHGRCENRWMDEHILVEGAVEHWNADIADINLNNIGWWTAKHNGYATREAIDELLGGTPDNAAAGDIGGHARTKRWVKRNIYGRMPISLRAFVYFFYRYVLMLGFIDGWQGLVFHGLQGGWYRFLVDVKLQEIRTEMARSGDSLAVVVEREYGHRL